MTSTSILSARFVLRNFVSFDPFWFLSVLFGG